MFFSFPLVYFCLININVINGNIFSNSPNPLSDVYSHLTEIFEKNLNPFEVTYCVDCEELLKYIPQTTPLIKISGQEELKTWSEDIKCDNYVIDLSSNFKESLSNLEKLPGWNSRAKFYILFNNKNVGSLLEQLFKKYIIDVIIFKPNADKISVDIFTYFPFKEGDLYPRSIKPSLIARFPRNNSEYDFPLFPNKYPKKWNNCVVKVAPVYSPPYIMCPTCNSLRGLEFLLLERVGKRIGVKFKYPDFVFDAWGEKNCNGKYSFTLGYVQNRTFDVCVGAFHVGASEKLGFDMTYPYMDDYLVMVVPKAKLQLPWKSLVDTFKPIVWISLLITQILVALILYLISMKKYKRGFSFYFLIVWSILFKVANSHKPFSRAEKVLLMFWIIYCLLMDVFFESKLQGILNVAHRERQIDTLEETMEKKYNLFIQRRFLKYFQNEDDEIDRHIQINLNISPNVNCLDASVIEGNSAIILERFLKYNLVRKYMNDEEFSPKVYPLSKKLMFFPVTMYFSKGFPLYQQINQLLRNMNYNGVITELYEYALYRDMMVYYGKGLNWKSRPLTLNEFKHLFYLLLIFLFCANIIFMVEILWNKFQKKIKK